MKPLRPIVPAFSLFAFVFAASASPGTHAAESVFPYGVDHRLRAMPGSDFTASTPGFARASLRISADGKVSGNSGVNRFSCEATVKPGSDGATREIAFGRLASTRMAGVGDAMRLESEFLRRLGAATSCRIETDGLSLRDAGGAEVLRFVGVPR